MGLEVFEVRHSLRVEFEAPGYMYVSESEVGGPMPGNQQGGPEGVQQRTSQKEGTRLGSYREC